MTKVWSIYLSDNKTQNNIKMTQNDKKITASQEIYMSDDCTAETLLANQTGQCVCAKYVDFRYGHCFEHPKRIFKLVGKTKEEQFTHFCLLDLWF